MKRRTKSILKITISGLCLALGIVLPFITGHIPAIGQMLCPMHIPVFLCGIICGPFWGAVIGVITPLLRSVMFSMPVLYPTAISMAFELCAYGVFSGLLYRLLPKKTPYIYLSLIGSMLIGRIVMGAANMILYAAGGKAYSFGMFLAAAFVNAVPGIILHILLIPLIIILLKKVAPDVIQLNNRGERGI